MKKEAIDWGSAVCSIVGFAGGGPESLAACEELKGQINNIGGEAKKAGESLNKPAEKQSADIQNAFDRLANQIKALGCSNPQYTNPNKLRYYFEKKGLLSTSTPAPMAPE